MLNISILRYFKVQRIDWYYEDRRKTKMRVLYVEDEKFLAEAVKHNLEKNGFKVDLAKIVRRRVQLIEARVDDKQIELDLPEELKMKIADADFTQVIDILLDNAAKYSKSKIVVKLTTKALSVENDGKTISAEKLPHVFERFYQVDKTAEGSGLGLAIAKAVCDQNHWKIVAESGKKNTKFTLSF